MPPRDRAQVCNDMRNDHFWVSHCFNSCSCSESIIIDSRFPLRSLRNATLSTPANPLAHKRAAFADNKKHIHPRISTSHSFRCRHYLLHTIEPWMHGARSPEIWLQHPCSTKHSSAFISLLDAVCQSRAQIYGRAASRQISLGCKVSARVLRVQLVHSCRQIHLHHR